MSEAGVVSVIEPRSEGISAAMADVSDRAHPRVVARADGKAEGFFGGRVIDFDRFSASLRGTFDALERKAARRAEEVVLSLAEVPFASRYIRAGKVRTRPKVISAKELAVCARGLAPKGKPGSIVLHNIPLAMRVDGEERADPLGFRASKLDAASHVVEVDEARCVDVVCAMKSAGATPSGIVLSSYAGGLAAEDSSCFARIDIGLAASAVGVFFMGRPLAFFHHGEGFMSVAESLAARLACHVEDAAELARNYGARPPAVRDFSEQVIVGDSSILLLSDLKDLVRESFRGLLLGIKKSLDSPSVAGAVEHVRLSGMVPEIEGVAELAEEVLALSVERAAAADSLAGAVEFYLRRAPYRPHLRRKSGGALASFFRFVASHI